MGNKCRLSLQELSQQVMSCLEKKDFQGALEKTEMIMALLPGNDEATKAKVLANRGFLQAMTQNYSDALESFQNASLLFKKSGDLIGMAIQTGNIGSVYRDLENYNEAIKYYQQALKDLSEQEHQKGIADQHSNLAFAYSQLDEIHSAMLHFEKAADIFEDLGEERKANLCRDNLNTIKANL